MTFSQRVVSITQDTILPKIYDNILNDNFATYRFIGTGKAWSGETLKRPIKYQKNTQGSSYSGMDPFSVTAVETRMTASYDVRAYEIPVVIPGLEQSVNETDAQVLNLVKAEMESTAEDALDDIGTMFYADGTGNSNKDFLGLDALDDDGTSVVTVGNISRTAYTFWKSTRTSFAGALTLAKLATMNSAISGGSASRQAPTLYISSETEFDLYESLLSPTVRANYDINGFPVVTRTSKGAVAAAELKGGMGYTSLSHRGIPWVKDEKATVGTVWMINENYVDWYGLKGAGLKSFSGSNEVIEGVYSDAPSSFSGLQFQDFMTPTNAYGKIGHIHLLGNLVTFQPRRLARATSVTGV